MNESDLVTALRDRVADVHPDLDQLVAVSTRAGTRIRRRRAIGVSLGAAAGVAVIAVGAVQLAGGTDPRPADGSIGIAAEPTATPTPSAPALPAVGSRLVLPSGATATVLDPPSVSADEDARPVLALTAKTPATEADRAWVASTYAPARIVWTVPAGSEAPAAGLVDHVPAEITVPGWTCEWYLVDDKAACSQTGGGVLGLAVRSAVDHDSWIADHDKGAGAGVYTTDVHGDIFITVHSGQGTTDAELAEVGRTLHWLD